MVIVTLQRAKCIGCNYCVEFAPEQFRMSKKDGKSILLQSEKKKAFFVKKIQDNQQYDTCLQAKDACPVNIIEVIIK
jgi:ferredoxin